MNEMWIGVCGEGWTMKETDVVCRQLHFNNGGIIPIQLAMWMKVIVKNIGEWFDYTNRVSISASHPYMGDVSCTSSEENLYQCSHDIWYTGSCAPVDIECYCEITVTISTIIMIRQYLI